MAIVSEIHTHARKISRRSDARGTPRFLEFSHARVYFARPTVAIAKIRDYSQSTLMKIYHIDVQYISARRLLTTANF